MSFGPKEQPRVCPSCHAALPLPSFGAGTGPAILERCPACGADVRGPGDVGKALVEAMTDVLGDPIGKRKQR